MAQHVKSDDLRVDEFSLGTAARTRRAKKALAGIASVAKESPHAADTAAILLESVADVLRERRAPATMPAAEQETWEDLGGRFDTGAIERSTLRSRAAMAELVANSVAGDAAVSELLGVDRSRISQRVSERSLYAIDTGSQRHFPRWQFAEHSTVPHLRAVLRALDPGLHPLTVTHWFLTPSMELELEGSAVSPREWLVTGGPVAPVQELASLL